MKRNNNGFTLIELLIVVAIIGILSVIAVPNFLNAQIRTKIAACKADMRAMSTALESYFIDWNTFPGSEYANMMTVFNGLYRLTTPISYMTSIPVNPFGPQKEDPEFQQYEYGSGKTGEGGGVHPMNAYLLESHGPMRVQLTVFPISTRWYPSTFGWKEKPAEELIGLIYQSSNGLLSRGQIFSVGGNAPPEPGANLFYQAVKGL